MRKFILVFIVVLVRASCVEGNGTMLFFSDQGVCGCINHSGDIVECISRSDEEYFEHDLGNDCGSPIVNTSIDK